MMFKPLFLSMFLIGAGCAAAQDAPPPPPYSPVIEKDGVIYLSGHIGFKPGTRDFPEGIGAETQQVLENIETTLAAIDASLDDIVRCQLFLTEMDDYDEVNAAYGPVFGDPKPARTTVAVAALPVGASIEIQCTAVR